ncbi:uncharacterized protein BDFB_004782, partial [Asbolus verrucosus]
YNTQFSFQSPWNFFHWKRPPFRRRPNRTPEKEPARPPSPFSGTEEYTLKKIQEASDMIKKQLMMPPDVDINMEKPEPVVPVDRSNETVNEKKSDKDENERSVVKSNKKTMKYNVKEIHQKIITHITNLNHGKKMNLICATSSGYDVAIQQIQRQKRLELSKVLRDMCSNHTVENSDVINSIIPDIGIKLEDLPLEVIRELSSTLDLNFEHTFLENNDNGTVKIKTEVCESNEFVSSCFSVSNDNIKSENNDCFMNSTESPHYNINFSQNNEATNDIGGSAANITRTNSEGSQTDTIIWESNSTQTDLDVNNQFQVSSDAETLEDAVKSMLEIDKEIARLTEMRQSIFIKLQNNTTQNPIKRKKQNKTSNLRTVTCENDLYKKELDFGNISEKILVMKVIHKFHQNSLYIGIFQVVRDTLLAASESGKVFYINVKDGTTSNVISIGEFPVTSLCIWSTVKKRFHIFVGSLETRIREYDFDGGSLTRLTHIGESVQCMELAWDFIFIGTVGGTLMRHSLKLHKIEFEEKISKDRILVLKATQEGARRVLLVGTRNLPVCIRDAMSGLHMRTMNEIVAPTVYSLLLENSLVYCGTTFHDILVFSFHDGNLLRKYQAGSSKGISCMKIVENLLFASCYNGNVYVYNTKTRQYVGLIKGPGGVILSMEILKNIIIVGTMSFHFKSVLIPEYILESNRSAFEL